MFHWVIGTSSRYWPKVFGDLRNGLAKCMSNSPTMTWLVQFFSLSTCSAMASKCGSLSMCGHFLSQCRGEINRMWCSFSSNVAICSAVATERATGWSFQELWSHHRYTIFLNWGLWHSECWCSNRQFGRICLFPSAHAPVHCLYSWIVSKLMQQGIFGTSILDLKDNLLYKQKKWREFCPLTFWNVPAFLIQILFWSFRYIIANSLSWSYCKTRAMITYWFYFFYHLYRSMNFTNFLVLTHFCTGFKDLTACREFFVMYSFLYTFSLK